MPEYNRSIILRTYNQQQRLLILSENYGKLILQTSPFCQLRNCTAGTMIAFNTYKKKKGNLSAQDFSIIHQPEISSHEDILWLHHLLEACNFFTPLNQPLPQGFIFFHNSYALLSLSKAIPMTWSLIKQFCTATLYTLFGFFPPPFLAQQLSCFKHHLLSSLDFNNIVTINFFTKLNEKMPSVCNHSINFWIASCIQSHPQALNFKTYTFQTLKKPKPKTVPREP